MDVKTAKTIIRKKIFGTTNVTGIPGCYCRSQAAHDREVYPGGHCVEGTWKPDWERHGFLCSKGHGSEHGQVGKAEKLWKERYPFLQLSKKIDISSAAADLYILEAIAYDLANPRPMMVTDVLDFNFKSTSHEVLLKMIGVSGPKTQAAYAEKYRVNDSVTALEAQYEKWKAVLSPKVPLDASLAAIKEQAEMLLITGTDILALVLREYMHYAAVSELTYHNKMSRAFDSDIGLYQSVVGWSDYINHAGGHAAAKTASAMFRDKNKSGKKAWGASYGGVAWARATDVLGYFEAGAMGSKPFTAKLFCDRMFTLQHNTGSILNKISWGMGRGYGEGYNVGNMAGLLDAHHNSDWYKLEKVASEEVAKMLLDYWTITNREFIRAGLEPNPFPICSPIYTKKGNLGKTPNSTIVSECPLTSSKATVVVAISPKKAEGWDLPEAVVKVGKKAVYKTW